MQKKLSSNYNKIYEIVRRIPVGKVATYGQIAQLLGNKNLCRIVGNALHANPEPEEIPCHRVVNSNGKLAEHFAFGGAAGQKERLEKEGVEVVGIRVDLEKYAWNTDKN